jgi:UDP-N-acetylmuramoylalanine--D-glutamate ligase
MSLYIKGRKIKKAGFVGFGLSNSTLYRVLRNKYKDIDFTFRLLEEKRADFMKNCYTGADIYRDICEDVLFFSPSFKREKFFGLCHLSSEYEYFFENFSGSAFAVSGSDGKSTSAAVAASILGDNTALCGNIGIPACLFTDHAGKLVIELSSFQLNYFEPRVHSAVLTSLSENHLDFHGDFEKYVFAKENLLKFAENRALWLDSESERTLVKKYLPNRVISYRNSLSECMKITDAESYITIENGDVLCNGSVLASLLPIFKYGEYTVKNFMSAIALTLFEGGDIERAIRDFEPLSERCELILEHGGIKYFSSSIDSSPERTATTLSRFRDNVVLILGGRDKKLSLLPLVSAMKDRVTRAYFYGESGLFMLNFLRGYRELDEIHFEYKENFADCIELALRGLNAGESLLLSPAATSYDCFKNYRERGEKFREIIFKFKDR